MTRRRIKHIQDSVPVAVVVGHIAIVGRETSRWTGFDGVWNSIVVAIEIKKVVDVIAICINRGDAAIGSNRNSVRIDLRTGVSSVVVNAITVSIHDGCISSRFDQIADAVIVTVKVKVIADSIAVSIDRTRWRCDRVT